MRTVLINVGVNPWESICLGIRGEKESTAVVFDYSAFAELFGAGSVTLLYKRATDNAPYPIVLQIEGNKATWTVTNTDTNIAGFGQCELFYYVDEQLAKSVVFATYVDEDIGTTTQEPPDPYEDWVETLTDLGAETLQNAQDAAGSAADALAAKIAAEAAQEASETAQGKAEDAQGVSEAEALKAEGYAVGTQDGVEVQSGSPYYLNNSKFYSEVAGQTASNAGWVYFYIDDNGVLHYVKTENCDLSFYIDDNGILHVTNAA